MREQLRVLPGVRADIEDDRSRGHQTGDCRCQRTVMLLSRGLEQMRQEASRRMPSIGVNLHGAADALLRKSAELINTVAHSARGISENRRSRAEAPRILEMASAVQGRVIGATAARLALALIGALA